MTWLRRLVCWAYGHKAPPGWDRRSPFTCVMCSRAVS